MTTTPFHEKLSTTAGSSSLSRTWGDKGPMCQTNKISYVLSRDTSGWVSFVDVTISWERRKFHILVRHIAIQVSEAGRGRY